jgi:hypothetical protein
LLSFFLVTILNPNSMKKLLVVMERDADNEWQAWSDVEETETLLTAIAPTTEGVLAQLRELIVMFQKKEWLDVPEWAMLDAEKDIEFEFAYSLVSFFDEFNFLKISEVAKAAKLNPALVRAYANGDKNPSLAQAQKIQEAAHRLAQSLLSARIVPTTVRQAA